MGGSNTWVYVITLAVAVLCAVICARVAGKKGHSSVGYAILGFFLPLVGIIVVLVIKDRAPAPLA